MQKLNFMSIKRCVAGIALVALFAGTAVAVPLPGGTLDPLLIPKYVQPLVIPPEMPKSNDLNTPAAPVQQAYIPAQRAAAAETVEPEPAAAVNPG